MKIGAVLSVAIAVWTYAACALFSEARAGEEMPPDESAGSIEQLLKSGWQIAGYAGNSDSRSTFILFRNPSEPYLVQCLTGYDVTRTPRVFENCYRLR